MAPLIKSPRKLIEVALPLDVINVAAAREKSIRHGHPSTLHLWWARRPLAAARAVIFAQMVNDPGYQQGGGFKYGMEKKKAAEERKRLFKIIEDLVQWENTTNEVVLERARVEIRRSWREVCELNKDHPQAVELFNPEKLPALHDPFAGGGSIPLEAQRLGLEAYASDLNPVAVLINKAMIEIPPKFAGQPPVNPEARKKLGASDSWKGAQGLAEDVRYYGAWMREEAQKRIGHLYPPIEITAEMAKERPDLKPLVGQKLTVIAWLWARTVKSPNPAFSHVDVPLASTFFLSSKEGKSAYVQPVIEGDQYRFTVRVGMPPAGVKEGTKLARGANFKCVLSNIAIEDKYIKSESMAGRMSERLMAIVAEGKNGRVYLDPTELHQHIAHQAVPAWKPDQPMSRDTRDLVSGRGYGFFTWADIFTSRQLVALTTFSDLVGEAREQVYQRALDMGMSNDEIAIESGGNGAKAYADAVGVYLAFAQSKACNRNTSLCLWEHRMDRLVATFGRQALPMVWDFAETNPLAGAGGDIFGTVQSVCEVIEKQFNYGQVGKVFQNDAVKQTTSKGKLVSTDPPYYNNISYADLSDFFYIWLRQTLRPTFPDIFTTIAVPKSEELVATPYRHGSKEKAEDFFLNGMTQAMRGIANQAHLSFPVTIYYAFKQASSDGTKGTTNTGWDTFLAAVIEAGFTISGTWPMRTEQPKGLRAFEQNALASSIILVCRKRTADALTISRREFIRELNAALPEALDEMTRGAGSEYSPVAPVDLSQAIIGPGMAIFSKYAAVLEADGSPMSVRTALQQINRFLAEDDFDADSQFCLHWFEQYGWREGAYGEADVLARSKAISINGLAETGVVLSGGGKVQLCKWADYATDWQPPAGTRPPVWESLHHLIRALRQTGETGAGQVLIVVRGQSEAIRQLAYRLYTLCERQGWAEDARAYNELVTSWTGIENAAYAQEQGPAQADMDW